MNDYKNKRQPIFCDKIAVDPIFKFFFFFRVLYLKLWKVDCVFVFFFSYSISLTVLDYNIKSVYVRNLSQP